MSVRAVVAGAAVLALAACFQPPLTESRRRAIADSLEQYVAGPFAATFEHPTIENVMALYVTGSDLQAVENGFVYPSRDSLEKDVRAFWGRPGLSARFTFAVPQVAVLSRDAAVYTTMVTASLKDSAGVETRLREAWTAVFVRADGNWRILAGHASWLPPAGPTPPRR